MKKSALFLKLTLAASFALAPVSPAFSQGQATSGANVAAASSQDWLMDLPGDGAPYQAMVTDKINALVKRGSMKSSDSQRVISRISKYMGFLMYNFDQIKPGFAATKKAGLIKGILARLMISSTQFIMCPDLSDFACLDQVPVVTPSVAMRVEDPKLKLGEMMDLNESLDQESEWYFTKQIFVPEDQVDLSTTLEKTLAHKIQDEGKDGIYMALYGIDDIQASMKDVYDGLMSKIQSGVDVKAVVDQQGPAAGAPSPLLFSYLQPTKAEDVSSWILSPLASDKSGTKTNMDFMYNVGTQGLIQALAQNAKTEDDAKGRIEYPNDGIMHNKFFVFKNGNDLSVWSGTANVARTCMGTERNSNMSVFIRSTAVAKAFMDEFNQMYTFQTPSPAGTDPAFRGAAGPNFPIGRFHSNKTPNTHRFFHFDKDDSDLKVYFSPTDDGEHRAILPMLYSAQKGDVLRISMFGAAGIEYVKALEYAAAKGVIVEIIVDSPTAFGISSWAGDPAKSNSSLLEPNPYNPSATVTLRKNGKGAGQTWKQNHQKIGILLRRVGDQYRPEQMIVGSQNWSESGNDKNDENLLVFRNRGIGLRMAADYDDHFRNFLWPHAATIDAKDVSAGATDASNQDAAAN